jgi:hypothetical protein
MDVPSVDRRIVEGAIHRRITESNQEVSLSKYPKKYRGSKHCFSIGVLFDWRALFTLP